MSTKPDYSSIQKQLAIPEASSMIETFRAIGYSIEAAVADIIDNSISANAKNIWINFEWKGADSWLSIKDDGHGMNNDELIQAMRPGSKNPLDERNNNDLGRFGLGLKTASFSQCRKLSVISKKEDSRPAFWTWDLDFIKDSGKWELLKLLPRNISLDDIQNYTTGTIVIWNDIDRVVKNNKADDQKSRDNFLAIASKIERHLSMVFHRYIDSGKIRLFIQGRKIISWDPYMLNHPATQSFPDEPIMNGQIIIKGFVLPHRSKLGSLEYDLGKGPKDSWTAHQGFYIYRNNRLLVAGDWLGLFKRELHYDLCRIQIDLPNKFDIDWQIDIKKSIARPPSVLIDQIRSYSKEVRATAVEAYRIRGKIIKRSLSKELFKPIWNERIRNGKRLYEINRNHPIIADLLQSNTGIDNELLNKAIRYIEETIPVQLISLRENEQESLHSFPFENDSRVIIEDIKKIYYTLISNGNTKEQAKRALYFIEPFDNYSEIIEKIDEL